VAASHHGATLNNAASSYTTSVDSTPQAAARRVRSSAMGVCNPASQPCPVESSVNGTTRSGLRGSVWEPQLGEPLLQGSPLRKERGLSQEALAHLAGVHCTSMAQARWTCNSVTSS
jgi:hypothetical protein